MLDAGKERVTAPPEALQDASFYQVAINLWQPFHQLMSMTTSGLLRTPGHAISFRDPLVPLVFGASFGAVIFLLCYEK